MRTFHSLALVALLAAGAAGQNPDVIVGSLNGVDSYGSNGGIYAYALGTTSCNIGTSTLKWIAGTNEHPVIGQNIYRLKNGRFELIGISWLKHGFTALAQSLCATCQNPGTGSLLGVNCSDPYSAGLNGSQGNGPRNEVNATTGYFPYPIAGSYPSATATIGRRIQVAGSDVNPAENPGALYFGEGQYITADDAAAGNGNNNASYRAISFDAGADDFEATLTGPTFQGQPAIMAWKAADPSVVVTTVDWSNDGRFYIAKKVTALGGGNFHWEIAVHNLNSHASAQAFTVDLPPGAVITNAGFKDINYHSGEPYTNADWNITINGSSISWAGQTYIQNVNANALRWGTLYNFWFDATAATSDAETLTPFRPYCPVADPDVPPAQGYTLNTAAAYDDPTLTSPINATSGDDAQTTVAIGFNFTFYGNTYTQARLSTNGFLSFSTFANGTYSNSCLPNGGSPNNMIAPFWDDLIVGAGELQYQTLGTAPNRRFVAAWTNVNRYQTTENQTFKVILDETTNKVTTTIVATTGGSSATRGIENADGSEGVQSSCNTAGGAVAGTSHTYTPYSQILPSVDLDVTVVPGTSITWDVNSAVLGAPLILIVGFDPGPTDLGPLGVIGIGLLPDTFVVLADGLGLFVSLDGTATTDGCGNYVFPLQVPGMPGGIALQSWVAVFGLGAPNGLFHFSPGVPSQT